MNPHQESVVVLLLSTVYHLGHCHCILPQLWDGDKLFKSLKDPKYQMELKSWPSNSKKKPPKEQKTKTAKSEKKTKAKGGTAVKQSNNKKEAEAKEVAEVKPPLKAPLETPLDQSPCTAFLNAGGSRMLEDNETDVVVADGSTDTDPSKKNRGDLGRAFRLSPA